MGNNWKWALVFGSIAVMVTGLSLTPVSDPDIWIMLATGRQIMETGRIPVADTWSHTALGRPWVMHEWLSSLFLFGLYKLGGFPGIIIVKVLLLNLLFAAGIIMARGRGLNPLAALLVSALAVMAARIGFSERIQIITFLGLAGEMFLIDRLERGRVSSKVFLMITGLGFALWANLHLGLMAGLLVLAAYCLDRFVWGLRKREWKSFITASAGLGLALAATLINPYGFGLLKPFVTFYSDPRLMAFDELVFKSIHEYTSIFSPSIINDPSVRWGIAWLAFSALGMILNRRNFRLFHLLQWAAFFYFAFYAVRYLPVFVAATMGFTLVNWNEVFSLLPGLKLKSSSFKYLREAVFVLCCLLVTAGGVYSFSRSNAHGQLLGLKKDAFPVRGVEFVKANFSGLKILNDFYDGGYLLWHRIPTFIDGRLAPFQDVLPDYLSIIKGDSLLLKKYGVELALLRYPRSGKSQSGRLHRYLSASPEWALVYWDDVCLVFVKREAAGRETIAANEYRHLNPLFPDETVPLPDFLGELERKYREDSTSMTLYLAAFNYFYRRDINTAEQFVRQGLALYQGDASLHNNLGNVHLTKGDRNRAIAEYSRAIKLDRNFSEPYCNLGYIYEREGDHQKAEKYYQKVLAEIDPLNVWAYNRMGLMLAGRGEYERAREYLQKGANIDPNSEAAWNLRQLKQTN
jgi:tetratricopeptide (TPR) repeat protein